MWICAHAEGITQYFESLVHSDRPVMEQSQCLSALLCHAHVQMGLECLPSIRRHLPISVRFQIHDDGSLTADDFEKLESRLAPCEIVCRDDANMRLEAFLSRHPNLAALRRDLVLGLKLIDTVVLSPEPRYVFCDADVLFLRPLTALPFPEEGFFFMQDRMPSYSLRSWGLAAARNVRLPKCINTGFVSCSRDTVDWDFLDWFVSRSAHRAILPMLEQTAWAALGAREGCRVLDPRQARIMRDGEATRELAIGHFTARTRHLLPGFVEQATQTDPDAPRVTVRTADAGRCTAVDLARYETKRALQRILLRN